MSNATLSSLIAAVLVIGAIVWFAATHGSRFFSVSGNTPVVCTMEARQCADGSWVERVPPYCDFAACPSASSTPNTGLLEGKVLLGPTCPVQHNPPAPGCEPRPYQTTLQAYASGQSSPFATVRSDEAGAFRFELPAGSYTVEAVGGSTLPRCPARESVKVATGATTTIAIDCDTGIR